MEQIKNVIVKQQDIMSLIDSFNQYYVEKQKIFDETERLVNEEELRYKEWNDARFKSDDISNFPEFKREVFNNKKIISSLTIRMEFVDGSAIEGSSVEEFKYSVATFGFEKMESITLNMNLAYQFEYKADNFEFNQNNRISQDVTMKFTEDSIYYSVSGENCNDIITYLKNIILDKISNLEPRLSKQSKEYSRYDKAYHKVDNLKDYVAYPEVHIGPSSKKAGVRETIKNILKKSKRKNIISFLVGLVFITIIVLFLI